MHFTPYRSLRDGTRDERGLLRITGLDEMGAPRRTLPFCVDLLEAASASHLFAVLGTFPALLGAGFHGLVVLERFT